MGDQTLLGRISQPFFATAAANTGTAFAIMSVAFVWITLSGVIRRRILEISDGYSEDWAGYGETTEQLVPPQVKSQPQNIDVDGSVESIAPWVEARLRNIITTPNSASSGDSSSSCSSDNVKDASSTSVGGVWEFPF